MNAFSLADRLGTRSDAREDSARNPRSACGCLLCKRSKFGTRGHSNANSGQRNTTIIDSFETLLHSEEVRWNAGKPAGTPVTLTYSFMTKVPTYYNASDFGGVEPRRAFSPMTDTQKFWVREVLKLWSEVANIKFVEVSDRGKGGTLRFGTALSEENAGWAYIPSSDPWAGDVFLKKSDRNTGDLAPGTFGYSTLIHEIGHALGLKHPGNYDVRTDVAPFLPTEKDTYQYSVMSYNPHPGNPGIEARTPQLYDILAIQYLYGVNTTTRKGNTVYSWDRNESFLETIWDAGGRDTIDASNQTRGVKIDLRAGQFSSVNGTQNLAIAYGVVIENAKGGSGRDIIIGNAGNNLIEGNKGNDGIRGNNGDDLILGGGGKDLLLGDAGDDFLLGGEDNDTLKGGMGRDELYGGTGTNQIFGGAGSDVFMLTTGAGYSVIRDYADGVDNLGIGKALQSEVFDLVQSGRHTRVLLNNDLLAVVHNVNNQKLISDIMVV